jgi:hypothetical protein
MSIWDTYKSVSGYNNFDSFLHPERGYQAAEDAQRQSWMEAQGFLNPYNQAGKDQLGRLTGAEDQLLHPDQLLNQWTQGYSESPFAKQLKEQASNAGLESASQQGLLGSSAAVSNVQSSASNIMNAERNQYLQDLMQKYMVGIGVGQNIYNTGANAAGALASGSLQNGQNIAQARFGQKNAPGDLFGKLAGTAIGAYSGGGVR